MIRILYLALMLLAFAPAAQAKDGAKSGFDRVMQTRTLRCAYDSLPPFINVDPATHAVSGMMYDMTNEIGKRLGLKVEWTENSGYGEIAEGLNAGRFDAFCGVLWRTPARAGAMSFSTAIYKNKVFPCVRGDTTEYDASTDPLNSPDKTLAGYDGDVSLATAQNLFPKAKITSLPANMSFAEALTNITTKKIDAIATCDRIVVDDFNKKTPNGLKIAAPDKPITNVQIVLALPLGDTRLKSMTDTAIYEMTADGTIERIVRQYLAPYIDNTIILNKPF